MVVGLEVTAAPEPLAPLGGGAADAIPAGDGLAGPSAEGIDAGFAGVMVTPPAGDMLAGPSADGMGAGFAGLVAGPPAGDMLAGLSADGMDAGFDGVMADPPAGDMLAGPSAAEHTADYGGRVAAPVRGVRAGQRVNLEPPRPYQPPMPHKPVDWRRFNDAMAMASAAHATASRSSRPSSAPEVNVAGGTDAGALLPGTWAFGRGTPQELQPSPWATPWGSDVFLSAPGRQWDAGHQAVQSAFAVERGFGDGSAGLAVASRLAGGNADPGAGKDRLRVGGPILDGRVNKKKRRGKGKTGPPPPPPTRQPGLTWERREDAVAGRERETQGQEGGETGLAGSAAPREELPVDLDQLVAIQELLAAGRPCQVTQGAGDGEERFWNMEVAYDDRVVRLAMQINARMDEEVAEKVRLEALARAQGGGSE